MIRNSALLFIILSFALISCDKKASENTGNNSGKALPTAQGNHGEILILMDSAQWEGRLGDTIRSILMSDIPGLPQPEPLFSGSYIDPVAFNASLKKAKNLLFVTTLDINTRDAQRLQGFFTPSSLNQIKEDTTQFMRTIKDEFARGQVLMYLFSRDEEVLINRLTENKQRIQEFWKQREEESIRSEVLRRTQKKLEDQLETRYGFHIDIPQGYEIALMEDDFIWLRLLDSDVDRSIYVYKQNYQRQDIFEEDNLIALRNEIGKKYIYGSDEANSFMTTESLIPPTFTTLNFSNRYTVRMQGLWKLNNLSMGGPFISYTQVDEATNTLFYVEGFVYAPGRDKRDPMVEMTTVLKTFRPVAPNQ